MNAPRTRSHFIGSEATDCQLHKPVSKVQSNCDGGRVDEGVVVGGRVTVGGGRVVAVAVDGVTEQYCESLNTISSMAIAV